ncbi:hypothetical protein [Rhizobium populisoli]|uniref:hypothetical protein n=1 Tax=Rhizobium populisoli TaxID=2859785 RepID=UPI001CA4B712|nr:hypothetical protein [Rhizobium populisoli]
MRFDGLRSDWLFGRQDVVCIDLTRNRTKIEVSPDRFRLRFGLSAGRFVLNDEFASWCFHEFKASSVA